MSKTRKNRLNFTKQEAPYVYAYLRSNIYHIYQAYNAPSLNKVHIQERLEEMMLADGGYGYRILSYNTFMFVAAYRFMLNGIRYLKVFTPSHWGILIPLEIVVDSTGEIVGRTFS